MGSRKPLFSPSPNGWRGNVGTRAWCPLPHAGPRPRGKGLKVVSFKNFRDSFILSQWKGKVVYLCPICTGKNQPCSSLDKSHFPRLDCSSLLSSPLSTPLFPVPSGSRALLASPSAELESQASLTTAAVTQVLGTELGPLTLCWQTLHCLSFLHRPLELSGKTMRV